MKRTLTLFAAILLLAVGATAQKLSYQAVVRNTANELVYDAQVTVSLKILAADGTTVQYAETQTATTNQNGLLTIIIGESSSAMGSLTDIIWANASIRTDITLPTGDVVTNIMPVTAVPYALYADDAGGNLDQVRSDWTETNTESKAYILHKPTIPTAVSQLTNDVHYITVNEVPVQVQSDWTETNIASKAYIQNKPTIPTAVSQLTNDVHYITVNEVPAQVQSDWLETNTASTAYIQNKPAIPTSVSQLTNDVHYITVNQVPAQVQSDWAETNTASTAYIQNKPAIPTSVSQLTNDVHYITVNEVPVQVQSDWTETNTASKAYIQNKPTIPTAVSQLTNDVHYITVNEVPAQVQSDWLETNTASTAYIQNKPAIPTSVSQLTNDVHYITVNEIPVQVQSDWLETNTASTAYIQNKPTIPTVPTNVSAFQNDAHYVTQTQMESTGYLTRDSIVALQQTVNNLVALVNSLNMRMTQEQFTTTAGQMVFTLQHAPKQDCIIRCYVNGVMVGGNQNGVLDVNANNNKQVVYSASFNRNYTLKANDRVTIVYWY